jgi:hypothetical protein
MARQSAEKRYFYSAQNGSCIQQVIAVSGNFADVSANKVPALLARKSKAPRVALHGIVEVD